MAKSYKVGQQLKVNNLKVVVTAVDPKTGAATINYASGSGKTGFAGTLQGTGNLKGKISIDLEFDTFDDTSFADDYSVSKQSYDTGISAKEIYADAENIKGSKLTPAESKAAEALAGFYENGDIKQTIGFYRSQPDFLIKFNQDFPVVQKGNKTIGLVQLGSRADDFFYEVEDGNVTFRQADGYSFYGKTKLPLDYGFRKQLDGKGIQEQRDKWAVESAVRGR